MPELLNFAKLTQERLDITVRFGDDGMPYLTGQSAAASQK